MMVSFTTASTGEMSRQSHYKEVAQGETEHEIWAGFGPGLTMTQKKVIKCSTFEGVFYVTGESFSEALILASLNPQYDKRLFIEFPQKIIV